MRARSVQETQTEFSDAYQVETAIAVDDIPQGVLYDPAVLLGGDHFLGGTVAADLEDPVVQATLQFHLGLGSTSVSPYMTGGALVAGRPLFDPGRYLTLSTRLVGTAAGAVAKEFMPWRRVFTGIIDAAEPSGDDEDVLALQCRDVYADMLDQWIEPQEELNAWEMPEQQVDLLLGQLLDLGMVGYTYPAIGRAASLVTIGTPNMLVPSYWHQPGSTLLGMREAARLNGWDLRGRFNAADQYILTYAEPDRALAGPQSVIDADRYVRFGALRKSRDDVRNVVHVTPSDPPRDPVRVEDAASILKYRRKFLGLVEDAPSRIRNPLQAQVLANAILSDTKEPKVMAELELRCLPLIEINDVLLLVANGVQHDTNLIVAVSGYTHTFTEDGQAMTVLRTRDLPAAANAAWRRGEPLMEYGSTQRPTGYAAEGAKWTTYSET